MRRLISLCAVIAAVAISCKKQEIEIQTPTPTPDPLPEQPELYNCVALLDGDGKVLNKVDFKSAVSFVSEAGMYSIYAADVEGLSKKELLNDYTFPEESNVVAISCLYSLLGSKVDISTEIMHWMMSVQFGGVCSYDLLEGNLEDEVAGGYFIFDVDTEKQKGSMQVRLELRKGGCIYCQAEGAYTPGGENETLFEWNEMSRPVRAAFYDDSETGSNPPVMYFTNGQIEFGADISRTTYARIVPSAKICDGQSHDIATVLKSGDLEFTIRDFDSEWNVVTGSISIKKIKGYEYEVNVINAEGEDRGREYGDRAFRMIFKGELKDIHIERQIDNKFETGGSTFTIKSCVVDLSADVASIYMLQTEGVTTVEAAKAANPLVINFSTSKFGTSIGLSTDKANFAVSYNGDRWDASNLDTGSFICHEYNAETGLLHCQLANLCLLVTYKTVLKMEYKGTPVYINK